MSDHVHLAVHEGCRVRRTLCDISANERKKVLNNIGGRKCAARVCVVEVFDGVESARGGVVERFAQAGFICIAGRSFVRLGHRYHGGIVARVDSVELSTFPQGAEAGIAPQDARDHRYSRDAGSISFVWN